MTDKPIAVFGSTGAQGGPVVQALLDVNRPVRAIARTESKLEALAEKGVETVALDLADVDALTKALTGVAGAFVHLPFIPVIDILKAQAKAIATALEANNVPMTVFTLSGPPSSSPMNVVSFDSKAIVKEIIQQVKTPLVLFEPMGYLANLSAPFTAPEVVQLNELQYPLPEKHRQAWISVEDQASLAIAALERPDLAGKVFRIGTLFSGPELAAGLSEGLGREIRYVPITPEHYGREIAAKFLGEEAGEALLHDYAKLGQNPKELNLSADTTPILRELNMTLTPLPEWAADQPWEAMAEIGASVKQ